MIFFYVVLLFLLGLVGWLVQRRVGKLEKRYSLFALEVDALAKKPVPRQGNSRDPDAVESARRQYQLVTLVQSRDRLEARYETWQKRHERLTGWYKALTHWRGRLAPYLIGAVDTVLVTLMLNACGLLDPLHWGSLVQFVSGWITG